MGNGPGFIPDQAALGEDIRTLAAPADGSADYFFRMTQPVDRCGIDPVDAPVEARVNCGEGFSVVLRAPRELPFSAAYGPSPDANWRDVQVTLTQFS